LYYDSLLIMEVRKDDDDDDDDVVEESNKRNLVQRENTHCSCERLRKEAIGLSFTMEASASRNSKRGDDDDGDDNMLL
jgi:hypothetical protein